MPFYRFEELPQETISPHYSSATGATVTGRKIEVGKYRMAKGTGAKAHRHPNEQIIYVLKGKLQANIAGQERLVGPGDLIHIPPDVVHEIRALEASEFLSSKDLVEGMGSRGWSERAPIDNSRGGAM